ncbi:MAG: HAD family hydrolase, partial [Paracoccaceae bacterium]
MPAIKGLLFDKDGTLFDFQATWGGWTERVIVELSSGSAALADRLAELLGFDRQKAAFRPDSPVIALTVAEIRDLLLTILPEWNPVALLDQMNDLAAQNRMVEVAPLVPLFQRFRDGGLRVGLATNDAEMPAKVHLKDAGIEGLFDFVAGYDSGWGGKPETGQMQAFLLQTGLAAGEVAMVGDSLHDLQSGRAAGMRTVAVLTGIAKRAEL